MRSPRTFLVPALLAAALIAGSCTRSSGPPASQQTTSTAARGPAARSQGPNPPPINPFLAASAVPIAHGNGAQTDSVAIAGPTGPTETLGAADLTYRHLGPAHFGIAISPPYANGKRVIWSNGGDRISKLDYDTLDVLAELPLAGSQLQTSIEADSAIAELDRLSGVDLANVGLQYAAKYLAGVAGVYYLLDKDNTLFVGGTDSVVAYTSEDPADPSSPIKVRDEWKIPADIGGSFAGANLTFDGRIVLVTNEGWVVVVARDFSSYRAIQLHGAEAAAQHNRQMLAEGHRAGAADWVRNSMAVDEDGGIYVASIDQMQKVIWDGAALSKEPAAGAWSEPYLNGTKIGTGATPSLMGFGDEDQLVVITDGEAVMNVVAYWRNEVPDSWQAPAGAPSDRIAGQRPADMGDPSIEAIQTEQSVVVGGSGALVVNNDPASIPAGFGAIGNRVLSGYAGADPAFTPHGLQKFEWNPESQSFDEAWVNQEVSSANAVPIVSMASNMLYTVGARDGQWTLEGIDWISGRSAFHFVTGSSRYNTLFSGLNLDQDGRVVHTTMFGIVRYERPPGAEALQ